MIYACTKKLRKASMVEPFSILWWLNVEPLFIASMTGKMFRPRISLKIGRTGLEFQWSKCRKSTHFGPIRTVPFLDRNIFNSGVNHIENWIFLIINISIPIYNVGISNLFSVCECKKIDKRNIENRIVNDSSEAEKYEFIHESCVFS